MKCDHEFRFGFAEEGFIDFLRCEPFEGTAIHLFCQKCGEETIRAGA